MPSIISHAAVPPLVAHRFVTRAAAVARTEALWIWAPAMLLGCGLGAWRRKGAG